MLDRLAPLTHRSRIFIEPLLNGYEQLRIGKALLTDQAHASGGAD
jgi:hypothetical protein